MKLLIFDLHGRTRVGLHCKEEIVDLTEALSVNAHELAAFIGMGIEARSLAEGAYKRGTHRIDLGSVRIRSPILQADKILGVGMNYGGFVAAARQLGMSIPPHRLWFYRPCTCLAGPYDDVWLPRGASDLDYEIELAVVIGRVCRYVSVEDAPEVIAGFTIGNDLTLRNSVLKSHVLGKSFETHTPLGPWIVTPDEVGDPHRLDLRTWVNGKLRQESSTADMIANCYELIADVSQACTLLPGDVILTGTPEGSGVFQQPMAALVAGDVVKMEIAGIGVIENRIVDEPPIPLRSAGATWSSSTLVPFGRVPLHD